jgi:phosphate starvation-inducible membrane PsiE
MILHHKTFASGGIKRHGRVQPDFFFFSFFLKERFNRFNEVDDFILSCCKHILILCSFLVWVTFNSRLLDLLHPSYNILISDSQWYRYLLHILPLFLMFELILLNLKYFQRSFGVHFNHHLILIW